jgi:hypothetical protein
MTFRVRSLLPAAVATISLLAAQVSGGTIAAWWATSVGPALLVQDDATAAIRYSLCNGNPTPVLPEDKTITLPLFKYPPLNGTSLAGTGWSDGNNIWVSCDGGGQFAPGLLYALGLRTPSHDHGSVADATFVCLRRPRYSTWTAVTQS